MSRLVAKTVRNLIDTLKDVLHKIQQFVVKGTLSIEDFNYTKYNNFKIIP